MNNKNCDGCGPEEEALRGAETVRMWRERREQGADKAELPYERRPLRVLLWYWLDWAASLSVLVGLKFVRDDWGQHRVRYYEKGDPAFDYPYLPNTVTPAMMVILGAVLPLVLGFATGTALFKKFFTKSTTRWAWLIDFHHFGLGLLQAHALSQMCTLTLKNSVGRLRPSGFERLAKGGDSWNESYPSGHTTFCFAGMAYLAFFLCGKIKVFSSAGLVFRSSRSSPSVNDVSDPFRGSFAIGLLTFVAPMAVATYVLKSRLTDYAHDFSDVNAGAMIGSVCACFTYFVNFPSVTDEHSHLCRPLARRFGSIPCAATRRHAPMMGRLLSDEDDDDDMVPLESVVETEMSSLEQGMQHRMMVGA